MKKPIALALCALLVFGLFGCGASSQPQSAASASAGSASVPNPASSAPAKPDSKTSVLTGREVPLNYGGGKRIAAVMVDNVAASRPQRGLSEADILFELPLEGGITRFMALYEDYPAMPEVGPVRSIRESYLQLAMAFQPLYVSYGSGQVLKEYVKWFDQHERMVDPLLGSEAVARDEERQADGYPMEHTAYVTGQRLAEDVGARGVDDERAYNSTFFHFVPYGEAPRALTGGAAAGLGIVFSEGYRTHFSYTAASGQYAMSQHNSRTGEAMVATIDENNERQVAFDNVLVLFTEMPPHPGFASPYSPMGILDIQLTHGVGYYFNGGACEPVRWMKQSPEHALLIVSPDGSEQPVPLNAGSTYVALVDVERALDFTINPGDTGYDPANGEKYSPYY